MLEQEDFGITNNFYVYIIDLSNEQKLIRQ